MKISFWLSIPTPLSPRAMFRLLVAQFPFFGTIVHITGKMWQPSHLPRHRQIHDVTQCSCCMLTPSPVSSQHKLRLTNKVVNPVTHHVGGLGGAVEAEVLGCCLLLLGEFTHFLQGPKKPSRLIPRITHTAHTLLQYPGQLLWPATWGKLLHETGLCLRGTGRSHTVPFHESLLLRDRCCS